MDGGKLVMFDLLQAIKLTFGSRRNSKDSRADLRHQLQAVFNQDEELMSVNALSQFDTDLGSRAGSKDCNSEPLTNSVC